MTIKEKNMMEYSKNPTKCKNCDESFEYNRRNRKFCNSGCSATFNNKLRKEYNTCEYCEKDIEKPKKYCDNKCQQNKQYQDKLLECGSDMTNLSKNGIRKFLTSRDGYECSNCKISEWDNKKIVLEVEHKDGNSENNDEKNLCFLCPNCHSQTRTYKGKNRGNGRHYRRERYKEGKSY